MPSTLVLIFALSGFAALVFEALWFRLAGLALGNSVWSATLVLAAFMGGLTLGNALIARLHGRVTRPIRLYAWLELTIGISGVGVVLALPHFSGVLGPLLAGVADVPWLLNAARLAIAFTVLVLPATAMGATLPVLTEALQRANPNFAVNIGRLYGWNTLGAMLGVIATEAVLVRSFGITGSGLLAAALNFTAAVIALRVARAHEPRVPRVPRVSPVPSAPRALAPAALPAPSLRGYRYLIVAFVSGAVMLALEVVWFRFLLLSYPGTAWIFAVMLAIVLGGIALGGLAAARIAHGDDHCYRWLRHVSALGGAFVVLTYYGFDLFTANLMAQKTTVPEFAGFAAFLMLPVAVLSGAAFTMVGRAVKDELGSSLRTAGIATLWNTVGAMAGSLCAGFVLLPALGMERSLFVLAAAYVVIALVAPGYGEARPLARGSAFGAVALAAVCLALFPFGLMQRSFFKIVEQVLPEETLVATREGLTETVRYYRRDVFGAPEFYRLVTNGYSMSATTTAAKRYMKLYVYLPLALRTDARDALLISFGVGSTAKALTDSSGLRHIDVVDISRDVLEMSSVIYADDDNPLRDDRVHVHVEDGRFFLSTSTRSYDLITSEPPPPKIAGVVSLYSQEYFELIRDHLSPGGYTTYWLPVHELEPLDTLAIIRGFCNAFQDCSLWSGAGMDWMLMGSRGANGKVSEAAFSAQWSDSVVQPELVALGFESPEQMGSLFIGDATLLTELTEASPPLTDNHPLRLSNRLVGGPKRVPLYERLMDEEKRLERFRQSELIARLWPRELEERGAPFFRYERMIKNYFTSDLYRDAGDPFLWDAIDDVLTNSNLQTLPLWLLGTNQRTQQIASGLADDEPGPEIELELALGYLSHRDYAAALRHAERHAAGRGNLSVGTASLLFYLQAKNDRLSEATKTIDGLDPAAVRALGRYLEWFDAKFGSASAPPVHGQPAAAGPVAGSARH